MIRIAALLIFLLAAVSELSAAGEVLSGDFRTRCARAPRVTLDVWGGSLYDAISQIGKQSGITPVVSANVTRGGNSQQQIYLVGKNMPLLQALEWLAQALGCRYRLTGDKIYMTSGYEWVTERGRRYGVLLRNVETLVGIQREIERADKLPRFQRFINELTKIVTLFEPDYRVRDLEEHDDLQIKLNAQIPADLKPLFLRALTSLENPGAAIAAPAPLRLSPAEGQLIEKLSRTTVAVTYRNQPLKNVIADLAAQSGLNIGFDNSCVAAGGLPPRITLLLGNVNIQEALTALARTLGLSAVEMSPPWGVWLSRRRTAWKKMPSREMLWVDNVEVKTYSLASLRGKVDGETLSYWLRSNVVPDVWLDPLAAVLYHAPSANLLVIAPPEAQRAVLGALCAAPTIKALKAE